MPIIMPTTTKVHIGDIVTISTCNIDCFVHRNYTGMAVTDSGAGPPHAFMLEGPEHWAYAARIIFIRSVDPRIDKLFNKLKHDIENSKD